MKQAGSKLGASLINACALEQAEKEIELANLKTKLKKGLNMIMKCSNRRRRPENVNINLQTWKS